MNSHKIITLVLMDAPYESANSTTAFRIIHSALDQGHDVEVFAYEGAVSLTLKGQQPHANPVKGTTLEEEDHPTTKDWIASLFNFATAKGARLSWVNCGLCVDERGASETIEGPRRGGPKDFAEMCRAADAVLVIPTR